jgi:hypothetical protein
VTEKIRIIFNIAMDVGFARVFQISHCMDRRLFKIVCSLAAVTSSVTSSVLVGDDVASNSDLFGRYEFAVDR